LNRVTLFSESALRILDGMPADPAAKKHYDYMSGGLHWDDGFPKLGTDDFKVVWHGFLPRFLIACRASLTLGGESEYLALWEQIIQHAPSWPGISPTRRDEEARRRLMAAKRIEKKSLAELEDLLDSWQ
jgi:hypothetical protein